VAGHPLEEAPAVRAVRGKPSNRSYAKPILAEILSVSEGKKPVQLERRIIETRAGCRDGNISRQAIAFVAVGRLERRMGARMGQRHSLLRKVATLALASLLSPALAATTGPPPAHRNDGGISLTPVEELNQDGGGPTVIGGQPAKTSEWPASFYSAAKEGRCTATLVGPRALLLAAHCVGDGQTATIKVAGALISGTCTRSPKYPGEESADYALCFMVKPISGLGLTFETINTDPTIIKRKASITLTGYGCTATDNTGGNDGVFRLASTKIFALPGDPVSERDTILVEDSIAICPGDSGGGAYVSQTPERRLLVSVNSRSWTARNYSYLSSLSTKDGIDFLNSWISKSGGGSGLNAGDDARLICGVNYNGNDCR
jgi:Trypsin